MKDLLKDKRRLFEIYTQSESENNREEYKRKKQEVRKKVRKKNSMTDERLGQRLRGNFRATKKMFWRGVNGERKTKE